jgi:hypothetical protein
VRARAPERSECRQPSVLGCDSNASESATAKMSDTMLRSSSVQGVQFRVNAEGGISDDVCQEIVECIRVVQDFPKPVSPQPKPVGTLNSNPSRLKRRVHGWGGRRGPAAPPRARAAPALTVRVGRVRALRVSVLPRNRACNSRTCRCSWQTQRRFKGSLTRL